MANLNVAEDFGLSRAAAAIPPMPSRLTDQLVAAATEQSLLDVAYAVVDAPLGPLVVAATEVGVVRLSFDPPDIVAAELGRRVSPRVMAAPRRLDQARRELDEYFAGRRRRFDVALDLRLATGFYRTVLDHLLDIGYGDTASYATVAEAAGSPRAVRAVGTACKENPLPVVVPCHRVVRSDGSMGGYAGGPGIKAHLLGLEGAM